MSANTDEFSFKDVGADAGYSLRTNMVALLWKWIVRNHPNINLQHLIYVLAKEKPSASQP